MKRKISRYLNSKEKSEYDNLDKIFELYLNGNIKELLSEYVGENAFVAFSLSCQFFCRFCNKK